MDLIADEIGPAVIWSAIPLIFLAFIAGLLLAKEDGLPLLLAAGFACMAFACYLNADLTSAWSASNYYRTELLMGVGQAFAFIGLVGAIVLQGMFSGGLAKPRVDSDVRRLFSHCPAVWRKTGAGFHGAFHRATGKVALESPGLARATRELDHG